MTSPAVFVIGAQKCGTTTLYEDLAAHPYLTLAEKEHSALLRCGDTDDPANAYAQIEPQAGTSLVEVSTEYAKLPTHDVAHTAALASPDAQIVYIVRDPIARVISHHHHEVADRTITESIDEAVHRYTQLIDYSRYAYQVRPWIREFGADRVHIVRFETYMSDRRLGALDLQEKLSLPKFELHDSDTIHNAAADKLVAVGVGGRLSRSRVYKEMIRPRTPAPIKSAMKRLLLPKAPPRPTPPSARTLEALVRVLSPEVDALAELTQSDRWWNLEKTWLS